MQGEVQRKLGVHLQRDPARSQRMGRALAAMASEAMERPYAIPHCYPKGEYLLLFDPLDGSSNIDVTIAV